MKATPGGSWFNKVNRLKRLLSGLGKKKTSPDLKSRQGAHQKYLFNKKGRIIGDRDKVPREISASQRGRFFKSAVRQ